MKKKFNLERDFVSFVSLCNQYEVKYLVIGGYAVSIHGYPRSTKDLDILIELSDENAGKVKRVVDEFGFASMKLTKDDFLKKDFVTQLGFEPERINIINDVDGLDYEKAWQNRRMVKYEGVEIPFIGYNELLKIKTIAGRPQDIADIDKLKKRNEKIKNNATVLR
jgi:hypothetical protein